MKLYFASAVVAAVLFTAAPVSADPGDRPGNVVKMLYHIDPAEQCSLAASNGVDLRTGLNYCSVALGDPLMNYRTALFINRGIIKTQLNDMDGALADFNAAVAEDPNFAEAYVNRAGLLISLKRYDAARADIAKAIQMGTANMPVAYYSRAVIEDESGDYTAAYHDYQQALTLKPDYTAAARELRRFKVNAVRTNPRALPR